MKKIIRKNTRFTAQSYGFSKSYQIKNADREKVKKTLHFSRYPKTSYLGACFIKRF
jgi:hypothetical protein